MNSVDNSYSDIVYEVENGRARITLNRPEKLNALNRRIQHELHDALWEADDDTAVHCVIIKGAGRSFCSGYDLSGGGNLGRERNPDRTNRGARSFDDDTWQLERMQQLLMPLFDMHKPSIAQVHGHCLAGGTGIIGLCDLVIVADDARIGFPPARDLGVLPITTWLYNAGPQWAKRLILTGDTVTGSEAAETDARGHLAPSAKQWVKDVKEVGLHEVLRQRDEKFGDGRARVKGPEPRDQRGRLIEDDR